MLRSWRNVKCTRARARAYRYHLYVYKKKTKQRPVYIILATKLLFIRTVICNLLFYDFYDKIKIRETKKYIAVTIYIYKIK